MPKKNKKPIAKSDLIESLTRSFSSSGEQYQRLIDTSPDIVSTNGLDGTILGLSKAFERVTGYQASDWIGKPGISIFHPDDGSTFKAALVCLKKSQAVPVGQIRLKNKKGGYVFCEFGGSPLYENGKIVSFFTGYRDISGRVTAEAQLRAEKDFSQNLIDSSVDGIFAFDKELRYTTWNPSMELFTGLERAEVIGKRVFDIFPQFKEGGQAAYYRQALAGNSGMLTDWPFNNVATKQEGFSETYFSPLTNVSGAVIGGLGIMRDITEYKSAKEAMIKSEVDLKTSERKFRSLVEAATDVIATVSLDGQFTSLNPAWETLSGWTIAEGLQMRFVDLIHPEDIGTIIVSFKNLLSGQHLDKPIECRVRDKKKYIGLLK